MDFIVIDVNVVLSSLLNRGELTSWAKNELAKARKDSEENYIFIENL